MLVSHVIDVLWAALSALWHVPEVQARVTYCEVRARQRAARSKRELAATRARERARGVTPAPPPEWP